MGLSIIPQDVAKATTQTDKTQFTKITDGTNDATVKAASTAAVAADMALVVAISPNNPITTTPGTAPATYSAAITGLAVAALATDIFTITGSGTKTVKVMRVFITATRTSDAKSDLILLKRSTANTGGTSSSPTRVPYDSTNAAATATVLAYTANPTVGTLVGNINVRKQYIPVAASSALESPAFFAFGANNTQPVVLRGTSEVFAVNLNGQTITGPSFDMSIEWTEE